jgi:hypothetical protein
MKSFIATVLNTVAHYILLDAAHYTQGIKNYQNLGFMVGKMNIGRLIVS